MAIVQTILGWLSGGLAARLLAAYEIKLKAESAEQRLVADAAIADLQRMIADRQAAKEVRLATAGFWEMRAITAVIAGSFALHLVLVTLDTCFRLGWRIPAYPKPFDEWQGIILLSFFAVQPAMAGINAIAAAIRGRR